MRPVPRAAATLVAALLLPVAGGSPASAAGGLPGSLKTVEAEYADWLDAGSAVSTIDSGLTERIAGRGRSAWAAQLRDLTAELARAFASGVPYCLNVNVRGVRSPFTQWQLSGKSKR